MRRAGGTTRSAIGAGVCVVALSVSGCGGLSSVPLPGGADIGDDPIHVSIRFDNVLDLVPQSTVKVDGVPMGRVESIGIAPDDAWTAVVDVVVDSAADLPANAFAAVEQTSILGEKFVQLGPPTSEEPTGRLADGDVIPLDRTRHATEIEPVLGALSLLLNGGGIGQLAPIVDELSTAFDGREGVTRSLLEQADTLISGLTEQREDITRALDGLDALSSRVAAQNTRIEEILDQLPVATEVLEQQRPELTQLLTQLDRLGTAGTDILDQSKDDLIADLLALRPTLQQLAAAGDDLVEALPFIPTVPFPDGVEKIALGGSVNLFLIVDLQIGNALSALGVGQGDPVYRQPRFGSPLPVVDPSNPYYNGNGPAVGWPTISLVPPLPAPTLTDVLPDGVSLPEVGIPGLGAAVSVPDPLEGLMDQLGIGGGR
ncbi:MAG: MCE family protein [Rhodococcus sp.]|uniref:MCE family protein n=1 Tax=Rhodococcus TaxID=1827 RepID=UPI001698659E|nr:MULTISPECIES: MCE family protein [Rhodococcus]NLV79859.1 MCE family protein [Rhodococcus sp. (in: high G+C Gram-positive bacteria)]